jgi:hypothetical protein
MVATLQLIYTSELAIRVTVGRRGCRRTLALRSLSYSSVHRALSIFLSINEGLSAHRPLFQG